MADFTYMVSTFINPDYYSEFVEWQETEHLPWLLGVDGYFHVRRLQSESDPFSFLNVWTIRSKDTFYSSVKQSVSNSPWSVRLRKFRTTNIRFFNCQEVLGDRQLIRSEGNSCIILSFPPNFFLSPKQIESADGVICVQILAEEQNDMISAVIDFDSKCKFQLLKLLDSFGLSEENIKIFRMLPVPEKKQPLQNDKVENVWPK